ncbi:hypothetical protein SAMN04515663_102319 [Alcanivorax sp. DSM 26293]|nr:hypothetical protein SAMN04515663_102319 [Alcanivorax sp. DSM 26293]
MANRLAMAAVRHASLGSYGNPKNRKATQASALAAFAPICHAMGNMPGGHMVGS